MTDANLISDVPSSSNKNISINVNDDINILEKKILLLELEKKGYKKENEQHLNSISDLKSELRLKNDQFIKCFEDAKKDRESVVLKFAQSEQKNMELQKKNNDLEGKVKAKIISIEQLTGERDRISKEFKSHIFDFSTNEKELNNAKVAMSIAEQKQKNEEIKLKDEIERNKDMKKKFEDVNRCMLILKEENSTLRSNCQEIVKNYQDSEDMRSNSLTNSIKQIKDELKKCEEERKEAQDNYSKINSELQLTKQTLANQMQELKLVKDKLKHSEADRICQEETKKQLKEACRSLNISKDQMTDCISYLEPFESQVLQLTQDNDKLISSNKELERVAQDCELHVETLRQKESELLEFIQSLSNKYANLQTEKQDWEKQRINDEQQIYLFEKKDKESYIKINFWEEKSKSESKLWMEEKDKFIKEIQDLKSEITALNQKIIDSDDKVYSINRRHKAHLKDLTRHLGKAGLKEWPSVISQEDISNEPYKNCCSQLPQSMSDRKLPSNSDGIEDVLNKGGTVVHDAINKNSTINTTSFVYINEKSVSPTISETPEIQMIEPHNHVFLEKIMRLQKLNAKFQEKIDFLTEHSVQLTQEIQKKSFLLKFLFSDIEEQVSLKSDAVDENHYMMSKKGGIMASVYSSRQADEHMTLDLSLEISRRLQSVLEDTIIKNITLKESINTLGEEIFKLKEENISRKGQGESL